MNVKANKAILELPEVDELFVFPSCGDETNSIGAAYMVHAQHRLEAGRPVDIEPIGSIYWGPEFSDADAELALKNHPGRHRHTYKYVDDIERVVAEKLAAARWSRAPRARWSSGPARWATARSWPGRTA